MAVHQVRLRKDGPTHAVAHVGKGEYQDRTLCGVQVGMFATVKRRKFVTDAVSSCQRCSNSVAKQLA